MPPVRNEDTAGLPVVTAQELVRDFEVIEIQAADGFILATPALSQPPTVHQFDEPDPDLFAELGTTNSSWHGYMREEYLPELRGVLGLRKFDQMRRSSAAVRSALRAIKTPVLGARWFIEPASTDPEHKMHAQHVHNCLFKYMSISFAQVLFEACLMLDFGYYMFEKVFDVRIIEDQPRIVWKKFAPRHPLDVLEWHYDRNGGPSHVDMVDASGNQVPIPIRKLAVFTYDREAGNMEGISLLRSAYPHWYFMQNLYKIDAIQKERHGIGVPVIVLPPGFNPKDKALAEQLGRNLRTNEMAHIVLPPMWEVMFAKLEGQPVNALESAKHHSRMIYKNILADFEGETGEAVSAGHELFQRSTRYIAEIIRDVFNKYCIPELVNYNWDTDVYPELRVRRIGDTQDWRIISFALRNLIGAGVVRPDDDLETWIRDEMDLPLADTGSMREVMSPQQARVGLPRQSTAAGSTQGKTPGGSRTGEDSSGNSN